MKMDNVGGRGAPGYVHICLCEYGEGGSGNDIKGAAASRGSEVAPPVHHFNERLTAGA